MPCWTSWVVVARLGQRGCDSQVDVGAQAGSSNNMFCSSAHRVAVLASYLNRILWRSLSSGRAKVVVPWMRRNVWSALLDVRYLSLKV